MKKLSFIVIVTIVILGGCVTEINNSHLPKGCIGIDITKEYPTKEICIQDIADIEYIPLETNDSVLLYGMVSSISDSTIIFRNFKEEAAYCFDRTGKFKWRFCRKGESGAEYTKMSDIVVDSLIYINDVFNRKIYIYNYWCPLKVL